MIESTEPSTSHVQTFFENTLTKLTERDDLSPQEMIWLENLKQIKEHRRAEGAASTYASRLENVGHYSDIPLVTLACSQGIVNPFEWRGLEVYKTVWDLAIYQILFSKVGPRTVIEFGTGTGGSAIWLADVGKAAGVACLVHTFDRVPPDIHHERVRVHKADFLTADFDLLRREVPDIKRPLLVIEDAHAAVDRTLRMAEAVLEPGDYLVVEDSYELQLLLRDYAENSTLHFQVVDWLLDFYGTNSTCALNSIWQCTGQRS